MIAGRGSARSRTAIDEPGSTPPRRRRTLGVSAAKPSDPQEDNLGGGQEDLCAAKLTAMLNDLMTATQGSQMAR